MHDGYRCDANSERATYLASILDASFPPLAEKRTEMTCYDHGKDIINMCYERCGCHIAMQIIPKFVKILTFSEIN
jgi:hypothetical protein